MEEYDEWYEQHNVNQVYPGYNEEPITFDPTYKRSDTDNKTYIEKNNQCPSYTDRVLFKTNCKQTKITQLKYECRENVFGSDHRPVSLHTNIVTKPYHYLDPKRLLETKEPEQGRGELTLTNT